MSLPRVWNSVNIYARGTAVLGVGDLGQSFLFLILFKVLVCVGSCLKVVLYNVSHHDISDKISLNST